MINPDDFLSDKAIEEALAPLRSVAVPEETHEANLAVIHQTLAHQIQPTWWRRSVAVPVPLAIASSLAFAFTAGALLKPLMFDGGNNPFPPSPSQIELATDDTASQVREEYEKAPAWSKTQSYIHSLVNSPVLESSTSKENRDDS